MSDNTFTKHHSRWDEFDCKLAYDELARLRQQLDGKDDLRRLVEIDLSELARLRRVNAGLVEALHIARAWMPVRASVPEGINDCAIVGAALRSATETAGDKS